MIVDMIVASIFAAIAGMGFGAISNPSPRTFKYIAVLAATGYMGRYILMNYIGWEIAFSSFVGALVIGTVSMILGHRAQMPMTVMSIPALLPMIPGKFAYNMIFSLIMFLQNMKVEETKNEYMHLFFANATIAITTLFLLALGATLPMFLFPKYTLSFTRNSVHK